MTVKQAWMVYTLLLLLMIYLLRSTPTFVAARLLCRGAFCLSKICVGKSQLRLPLKSHDPDGQIFIILSDSYRLPPLGTYRINIAHSAGHPNARRINDRK